MSSPDTLGTAAPQALDGAPTGPAEGAATDHALDVLLAVREQIVPELPEDLLRQCFAIQKQFQFDREEQLPIHHTRRLVESFVEHEAAARSNERPEGDE